MDHELLGSFRKFLLLFIALLLASSAFTNSAQAQSSKMPTQAIQLAWWYSGGAGWYNYGSSQPYSVYYEPRGNSYYWTPWERLPNGCKKTCLVNQWNGEVMRCAKKCI